MVEIFYQIIAEHTILAPIVFIVVRALTIILPPFPGIIIDLAGILAFGWWKSFLYAELGIMLGSMTAFFIARYFRDRFISRFSSFKKIYEWERTLSENKKFWTLIALRLPTNSLFDYISYAAGLTTISSGKFFLSTLLGNIPSVFLVYYLGGLSFQNGAYYTIVFLVTLVILGLVFGKDRFINWISKLK